MPASLCAQMVRGVIYYRLKDLSVTIRKHVEDTEIFTSLHLLSSFPLVSNLSNCVIFLREYQTYELN